MEYYEEWEEVVRGIIDFGREIRRSDETTVPRDESRPYRGTNTDRVWLACGSSNQAWSQSLANLEPKSALATCRHLSSRVTVTSSVPSMSSGRSSGASNSISPLPGQDEPNLENFFPPNSVEDGSCSVAFNNQIEDEVYESSDTDTSIESDPSECSEEVEGVIVNQDSQSVEIECDEACHVQWIINEEGQLYAVPLGEYNEDQVEDSLNNMLSQFYVETSNRDEDLGIPEMETIGEYGLGLSASMTALFEVPMIEEDGALGAENVHEAEMGINEAMGIDEAAENKAIMLEIELEHAIDQLIAECAQDVPAELAPMEEGNGGDDGNDSSSDSFESLTPEPADPNPSLSPCTMQPENILWELSLPHDEVIPEVMVNVMENQVVVQQDPQEVMIDEGKLKDQVADDMEVDGKSKGKRVAELEGEQGRVKDRRIITAEPHPLGIGCGVMSKVKPRIRATARKSVGGRRTSLVKASPPCRVCSRTDHHSDACPVAQPVQPYMVEYVKCYCCGGVGHVSMYCPYTASNVGEGSSRGTGPSATVATEEKCLNEGMPSFLFMVRAVADWLYIRIRAFSHVKPVTSPNKLGSQIACLAALVHAMNSTSHEDSATVSCFRENQEMGLELLNKWRERSQRGKRSIRLVLADQRGDMIEAKIKWDLISHYDYKFKDGDWIALHHFRLKSVNGDRRTTSHPYRIIFDLGTILNPLPAKDALASSFFDVSFREVVCDRLNSSELISLIGFVVNPGEIHYSAPRTQTSDYAVVIFSIMDLDNYVLECTAIGDLAEQFHEEWRRVRI
ncbi:hypothetical protein ISN45_Aa06g028570 [Arabidopsis thaliana x Arabidopsis arenosa]|uniref:CCHC-type domain-containing protein n=1 Tax=Arabidopsis thaliana x Arabidopsis arenosa TaxID=1240361 RepID=A0A8T1Z1W0_9BRAS|nr:hypothetical protein ISN45_Aa06g028570 [Arabidopsis thaliana x Arabidopsis arenosa]